MKPEVTFHVLGSVGECEGMNPPHSQVNSHFKNWNPNVLMIFRKQL
jgi:hypothetical protein